MNLVLTQIMDTVLGRLGGIVHGVERALAGSTGPDKKQEALKGLGEVLDGIAATGLSVPKDVILNEAGGLIDAYVAVLNAIGAFTHHAPPPPPGA